jgi:hypothetical protein
MHSYLKVGMANGGGGDLDEQLSFARLVKRHRLRYKRSCGFAND